MPQRFLVLIVFALVVTGCATTQDQTVITKLQLRLGELEREVGLKDNQIVDLQSKVNELSYTVDKIDVQRKKQEAARAKKKKKREQAARARKTGIIRVGVSAEKVQTALQNAGYYEGAIDNKIGAKTRQAISQFQKDNELKADGIVGNKTWNALKTYLVSIGN